MGEKSVFVKYFDAEVINTITDNKLRTVKVLILDDPKFKGRIIMGKGWLYDVQGRNKKNFLNLAIKKIYR